MQPVKLLYIAGWGRSGSTILTQLLGQREGFCSVGELWYLWSQGVVENRLCGCGVHFRQCPFWNQVLHYAYGGLEQLDVSRLLQLQNGESRSRHIPRMLAERGWPNRRAELREYREQLGKLYRGIQEVSGARVLVDSSKVPSYAHVLASIPGVELSVLHLVRDPRAVAFSWMRRRFDPGRNRQFGRISPSNSSLKWLALNLGIELLSKGARQPWRYLRVRYEDFVRQPAQTLADVIDLVGEAPASLSPDKLAVRPSHIVSGNPVRFRGGPLELKVDAEWQQQMGLAQQLLVTSLTLPLLLKYRYPLIGRRGARP